MQKPIRTMASLAVIAMTPHQSLHAGAFSLYTESSAAAIGNYAAGIAAEAADASTGWYNPAGLVFLKRQQIVVGGVGVLPSSRLSGTSTYTTPAITTYTPSYVESFSGLQAAEQAVVPSFHYALPLGDRAAFGFSMVSPFGLSTNYGDSSPVRYAATLSKLETLNVSPEIAGKLNDHLSVGLGLDAQYARVSLNSMIGFPAYLQFLQAVGNPVTPNTLDSSSHNSGDSFGLGFHAGAMLVFDDHHTRIGLNYQSEVNHQFRGSSQLTGAFADPTLSIGDDPWLANANAQFRSPILYSNSIDLPRVVTLSGYRDINKKWALLGSIVYTNWDSFQTITLHNVAVGVPNGLNESGTTQTLRDISIYENYRDAWRFSVGANYHVTDQWMMRFGGGYDQTPTVDAERDVRLPDSDRLAVSIGTHYQITPSLGLDAGYTYLFAVNDVSIHTTQPIATSTYDIRATAKSFAQLLGLQVVWKI
jgi:long-chain fatty acid transport protein